MLGSVLDYISRTNLFNFVIFLSILIFLFKKIDVVGMLENMKNAVIENIEASKTSKSESETHLKEIQEKVSHIEEEIDGIIKKSEQNAKLVGEKIIEDANHTVESIKDNSKKLVENKSALLKNDILRENGECDLYDICQSLISTYICSAQPDRRQYNAIAWSDMWKSF